MQTCLGLALLLSALALCRADQCSLSTDRMTEGFRSTVPEVSITGITDGMKYTPGQIVTMGLEISPEHGVTALQVQFRLRNSETTRGKFAVDAEYTDMAETVKCMTESDTVRAEGAAIDYLSVTWTAPESDTVGDVVVPRITLVNGEGNRYWNLDLGYELIEVDAHTDDKEEASNVAPSDHGLNIEIEMMLLDQRKRQDQLDAEDLASEGDWTAQREAERREEEELLRREEYEYEMNMAAEEHTREERIRAEILDAEEWERDNPADTNTPAPPEKKLTEPPRKPQEGEIDFNDLVKDGVKDNGAERTVSVLYTAILSLVVCVLLL